MIPPVQPRQETTAQTAIDLLLLGAVEMRNASSASSDLVARPKQLAFLTYLTLTKPEMFCRRDALLALFWPESDTEHARAALRNTLSRIRTALGSDVIETRGIEELRLRPGAVWCDVNEFRAAIAQRRYAEGLELYRGDLLEGFHIGGAAEFDYWLADTRHELRAAAGIAARELATRAAAIGDSAGAVGWSQRRLRISPDDEDALRDFMRTSAQAGDRSGALRAFHTAERRMSDAYELELSPATRQLAAKLRTAEDRAQPSNGQTVTGGMTAKQAEDPVSAPTAAATSASRRRRLQPWLLVPLVLAALVLTLGAVRRASLSARANGIVPNAPHWIGVPAIPGPFGRASPSLVYDSHRDQAVVFGGRAFETVLGDVWRLHAALGRRRWERVPTTNSGPGLRWLHAAAYDAGTDRMIVFGGSTGYTTPCQNDVWILPGAMGGSPPLTWIKLAVTAGPAPRAEAGAVYDAARNQLFVHGGHDCVAPIHDDLWVLSNANGIGRSEWRKVSTSRREPSPGARRNHTLAYDHIADLLILYGGTVGYGRSAAAHGNDVWVLASANGPTPEWRKSEPLGHPPPPLAFHHAFHDPITNRMLVVGVRSVATQRDVEIDEVWMLIGARGAPAQPVWRRLSVPGSPRITSFVGAYDPESNQALIFGGYTGARSTSGIYLLRNAMGE